VARILMIQKTNVASGTLLSIDVVRNSDAALAM
jgi:hypothetical protein